jgi:flagellar hook capping protein FlgD
MISAARASVVSAALVTLALATAPPAGGQVSPSNMQSGCTSFASGVGLMTTPIFIVPTGNTFVLTDLSISPTGAAAPPAATPPVWRIAVWLANGSTNATRWVSGGHGDYNVPNPTWPIQNRWTTGLVFPQNEQVSFGVSAGGGQTFPASTVCWSGYLVPNTTTSVIPGDAPLDVALRVVPNPGIDNVSVQFNLTRRQSVTLDVFSVEGRRIRTLRSGMLAAGSYRVPWDGRDDAGRAVVDGVYFARLETPGGSRTTKIAHAR